MKRLLLLCCMFTMLPLFSQAQSIPSYVPTNGLVGWWPFNGNANDESGNGNNGTVNGATLTTDRNGNVNSAYSFYPSNNCYISLPQPFLGGVQATEFTLHARIKANSIQNGPSIWSKTLFWGQVDFILSDNGSVVLFWANSITGNNYSIIKSNIGVVQAGQWYDIVIVFKNSSGTIFINGIAVPTIMHWNTQGGTTLSTTQVEAYCNFAQDLGSSRFGTYLNGVIDEFGTWNRALTPLEIAALYENCFFSIYSQPTNQSATTGNHADFNIGITTNCNTTTSYQWQTNLGFGWQTLQNAGQYTGVTTDHLQVSNVSGNNTNQQFRCIVSSGNLSDTSQAASIQIINNSSTTNSGITHAIPYQAVVRDGNGNLLSNHPLKVRFTLHENTASGNIIYQETHTISTSNLGLFTLQIGTGTPVVSSIDSINWALYKKFIQIEMDTTSQGTSYTDLGTQQLMAVPYALYAETAGNALNGPKGDKGDVGAQGPIGLTGATGPQGPAGPQGVAGNNGGLTFINPIDLYELSSYITTQNITINFDSLLNLHASALLLYYEYDGWSSSYFNWGEIKVDISANNNIICKDLYAPLPYSASSSNNFSLNKQYILKNTSNGIITFLNTVSRSNLKLKILGYFM